MADLLEAATRNLTEKQAAFSVLLEAIQEGQEIPLQMFLLRYAELAMATADHTLVATTQMLENQRQYGATVEKLRVIAETLKSRSQIITSVVAAPVAGNDR